MSNTITQAQDEILRFQESKLLEFKNEIGSLSSKCVLDVRNLLNNVHKQMSNKADDITYINAQIDYLKLNVKTILFEYQENITEIKRKFDFETTTEANEKISKVKSFIFEHAQDVEKKLADALMQINKSENFALTRIESTYNLGVETIVSAEKTSLFNLNKIGQNLETKLEKKNSELINILRTDLQTATKNIQQCEDEAINSLEKFEGQIKNIMSIEKEKILENVSVEIENFKNQLNSYVHSLEAQLETKKNQMLDDISLDKESYLQIMEKERKKSIELFLETEHAIKERLRKEGEYILTNIKIKAVDFEQQLIEIRDKQIALFLTNLQKLRNEIVNEIQGLVKNLLDQLNQTKDEVSEDLKAQLAAHIKQLSTIQQEFSDFINSSTQDKENDLIELTETKKQEITKLKNSYDKALTSLTETLKKDIGRNEDEGQWNTIKTGLRQEGQVQVDKIDNKGQEVLSGITAETLKIIQGFVKSLTQQRYSIVLKNGETKIQLPSNFVLNGRINLYIDGILQTPEMLYTVNEEDKIITLKNSYDYDTNIFVSSEVNDSNKLEQLKEVDSKIEKGKLDLDNYVNEHCEHLRGEDGKDGANGTIVPLQSGSFLLTVENGELVLYCDEDTDPPQFDINEKGELVQSFVIGDDA